MFIPMEVIFGVCVGAGTMAGGMIMVGSAMVGLVWLEVRDEF